jgi:glucokinase
LHIGWEDLRIPASRIPASRERPLLVGIDIGGTKVAVAAGDASGAVAARWRRPTDPSGRPEEDLARLVGDVRAVVEKTGATLGDVAAIGVTAPGPLDPERGVVLLPPNLPGWRDVAIVEHLAAALGRPVFLENDANAAALAEWHFGAARGLRHVVYLTMSTGVGGGLILDGRLYRGVLASAGEVGHVPVEWEGESCACGQRGCLEAYVGGAAWMRRLRTIVPEDGRVAALAGGQQHVTPVELVAAAHEGDGFARAELSRWCDYVARGVTAVVMMLAPEAVVLGTIAVAAGEELAFAPIREQVAAHVWPHLARDLRILPAALGDELPYLAGLSVAVERLRADAPPKAAREA